MNKEQFMAMFYASQSDYTLFTNPENEIEMLEMDDGFFKKMAEDAWERYQRSGYGCQHDNLDGGTNPKTGETEAYCMDCGVEFTAEDK